MWKTNPPLGSSNVQKKKVSAGEEEVVDIWFLGSIGCALAPKICGGARTHENFKTQKSFGEIPLGA